MTISDGSFEQHDNHCWVTFSGVNWRIIGKDGYRIAVRCSCRDLRSVGDFYFTTVLDLSQVRWDEYIAACEAMLKEEWPDAL
jgi:hypothetical protein